MRSGHKPKIVSFAVGESLMRQGEGDDGIVLILDGVVAIDVDGERVAEAGPGAVLGERSALESGVRTATVTALTAAKAALVRSGEIREGARRELAAGHHREEDGKEPREVV